MRSKNTLNILLLHIFFIAFFFFFFLLYLPLFTFDKFKRENRPRQCDTFSYEVLLIFFLLTLYLMESTHIFILVFSFIFCRLQLFLPVLFTPLNDIKLSRSKDGERIKNIFEKLSETQLE